jgi:type VI secretion system protein ImpF
MADSRQIRPTLRSVLDRLVDEDPEAAHDPPRSNAQLLAEHRESVMRDVGHLLNTRRRSPGPPERMTDLVPSLVDYGLPDFISQNLMSADSRAGLRETMEQMLQRYEPRFKRVNVRLWRMSESEDRAVRLHIEALLHAEPAPITIAFDSVLDPVDGGLEVEGAG